MYIKFTLNFINYSINKKVFNLIMLTKDNAGSTQNIHKSKMLSIEKRLQTKIKPESNYVTNTGAGHSSSIITSTQGENLTTYSDIVTKGMQNKNSRTYSMDLSNSLHVKKTFDDHLLNKSNIAYETEQKGVKPSQVSSNFKNTVNSGSNSNTGSVKASFINNGNLNSAFKDLAVKNKKNLRTNSIVLYNEYSTNTNPNLGSANPLANPSNNVVVKKMMKKTKSGNATTFSRYLASINKSKGDGNDVNRTSINMNKSGSNLNINPGVNTKSGVNVTMYSSSSNIINSANTGKKSSASKKKEVKEKISFPSKIHVTQAFDSNTRTSSNILNKAKSKAHSKKYLNTNSSNTYTSSVLNTHSHLNSNLNFLNNPDLKTTNSMNISRDYTNTHSNNTRARTSKTPNEEDDEEFNLNRNINSNDTSPPLTNETKVKLNEIKYSVIELLNNSRNKSLILKELENLYKYVQNSSSPVDEEESSKESKGSKELANSQFNARKSILSSGSNTAWASVSNSVNFNAKSSKRHTSEKELQLIDLENELLKKENDNLKSKIETIDKKFDKMCNENSELRQYVKEKSDNIEELRSVLNSFKKELNEVKKKTDKHAKFAGNGSSGEEDEETFNNISIDQIVDLNAKEKVCPFNLNLNLNQNSTSNNTNFSGNLNSNNKLSIPAIHMKKSDDILDSFNDRLSDKERTACFVDILSKDDRLAFNKDEEIKSKIKL